MWAHALESGCLHKENHPWVYVEPTRKTSISSEPWPCVCRKDWAVVAPHWYQHSLPVMKMMLHKPQLWQVYC